MADGFRRAGAVPARPERLQSVAARGLKLAVAATACVLLVNARASAAEYRTGAVVMGTQLEVLVSASRPDQAEAGAESALETARHWDDVLTTWRPVGELSRLNAWAGMGPTPITPDLERALRSMLLLAGATHDLFNPAVGLIVERYRQSASAGATIVPQPVPPLSQVLVVSVGHASLSDAIVLDAGGFGKGLALDEAGNELRQQGVLSAFLNFGGSSLLAVGVAPDSADGWKVLVAGLEDRVVHGVLALRDEAISTSRSPGDASAGLLIQPASGSPVAERRIAVVRASDAASAEAWSKAAILDGRATIARAPQYGIELLIEDESGVRVTSGFWNGPRSSTPANARGKN